MVKIILGLKGTGKTKQMIELVNDAAEKSEGAVVCLEYGDKLKFDVKHSVRLIDTIPYELKSYQLLRGFITGLCAGNYDINNIFIDSLTKLSGNVDIAGAERFLVWCDRFGAAHNVKFIITLSVEQDQITEEMKKFI